MVTIKVECPAEVAAERQREFADTVIGAAVHLLGAERAGVRLDTTDDTARTRRESDTARTRRELDDEALERREAAFWAAAWSGC
ncbi:hypothetical protein GCM10010149_63290 [Nonomuraea roseoviolacea subsp. roseoviolacea]|uniref:Uncharacterized protein n=1 Tax=Nonomuraea roseoviolacea subsp. carminata TaxID=160689 RepID=A0ABT1K717_9ACTN|nr:hypothetical protein [Nonomuraea roseoviolacea]MCP2349775.1 hypothetical protein [Nonomuraea roseoviolacea subsp. carminata]